MKPRRHFTKKSPDAIPDPAKGKRAYVWDDEVLSLQLMVTDKGTKSFYLYKKIQGRPTRLLIRRYPDLHPNKARELAYGKLASPTEDRAPVDERHRKTLEQLTLIDLLELYLSAKRLKDKTRYRSPIPETTRCTACH